MKFEITKEQILEMQSWGSSRDAEKVKTWFPDAFKKELENGKTYKHKCGWIAYKICDKFGFGFEDGEFFNVTINFTHTEDYEEYPIESFKKLLISEAEKRGFKSGVWVDRKNTGVDLKLCDRITQISKDNVLINTDSLRRLFFDMGGNTIFLNGLWASIIE